MEFEQLLIYAELMRRPDRKKKPWLRQQNSRIIHQKTKMNLMIFVDWQRLSVVVRGFCCTIIGISNASATIP